MLLLAQTNHGFAFDNYSGIYGVVSNPANSVDSKYNIHINVLSNNQLGVSDIGSFSNFELETAPNGFNGLVFKDNLIDKNETGYTFTHTDILLPSVVWNFHERFAAGLLIRSRSFTDYNNVSSALLQSVATKNLGVEGFNFDNPNLNNTSQSWTEFGLNLSAVVLNTNYHFVKFGGTFKYYLGAGANEVRGSLNGTYEDNNLNLNTATDNPLISLNTYPATKYPSTSPFYKPILDKLSGKGKGIGGDIGMVYEWRPRETNRVDVRSNSSAVNKYKFKISASILDIGAIKYEDIRQDSITVNNLDISSNSYNYQEGLINNIIAKNGTTAVNQNPALGDVTFALPMSLNVNLDYIILNNKNYYINLNYIKGLTTNEDEFANTQMNMITVTPRYETRNFSVYLPVNFEATSGVSVGIGARYRYVTIGTSALSSMLNEGKIRHLYFGVSIPLMKELYR